MNGDSTRVHSRFTAIAASVTGTSTTGVANFLVNPVSYAGTAGNNDAGGNVLLNYQEYKMLSGMFTYTPIVGSTTAGIVYMAYFDNPEIIRNLNNGVYTGANILALVKNSPNVVAGPVWQGLSLPMGQRIRRPKYSIDTAGTSSNETADRCVHGIFTVAVDGVTQLATTTYGIGTFDYQAEGYGLVNGNLSVL